MAHRALSWLGRFNFMVRWFQVGIFMRFFSYLRATSVEPVDELEDFLSLSKLTRNLTSKLDRISFVSSFVLLKMLRKIEILITIWNSISFVMEAKNLDKSVWSIIGIQNCAVLEVACVCARAYAEISKAGGLTLAGNSPEKLQLHPMKWLFWGLHST